MHIDFGITLAGLAVGIVVGLTGMGGGALMTPILVIGFGVQPLAAVSSDLVASVVMKPIGGGIHIRRGTVHRELVRCLALGSIPGAFGGAYFISHLGDNVSSTIKIMLGIVLLIAAVTMVLRGVLARRRTGTVEGAAAVNVPVRVLPTVVIGLLGGLIVGMTSVGSGSLMIVALMMLYPTLSSRELVGTDLVQAIPLVAAAALGHLLWGNLQLDLAGSLLVGAIPGVVVGAHISSCAPDGLIRPVLVVVLLLTSLRLLGVGDTVLFTVGAISVGAAVARLAVVLLRRDAEAETRPAGPR